MRRQQSCCRRPMLGGFGMSASSAAHDASSMGDQSVERALALLAVALEIVDALSLSPHIGAKIQEAISSLETSCTD